jgi:hypothetical protein
MSPITTAMKVFRSIGLSLGRAWWLNAGCARTVGGPTTRRAVFFGGKKVTAGSDSPSSHREGHPGGMIVTSEVVGGVSLSTLSGKSLQF